MSRLTRENLRAIMNGGIASSGSRQKFLAQILAYAESRQAEARLAKEDAKIHFDLWRQLQKFEEES